MNRVNIIHDNILSVGGAEKLILNLLEIRNSKLMVNYLNKKSVIIDKKNIKKIISLSKVNNIFNILNFFKANQFLNLKDSSYIISGNFSIFFIYKINNDNKKFFYCHHLPKFAFDIKNYSLEKKFFIFLFFPIVFIYKIFYKLALKKFNLIIANSKYTQNNLKEIGIKSKVIYPPIIIPKLKNKKKIKYDFMSFGRLEGYKNIEVIIKAFLIRERKESTLHIVSGGKKYKKLKNNYSKYNNIKFYNWVSERKLSNLISDSVATIYVPKNEDFGMTAAESLAHGVPVIGSNSGGLKEILNKKNSYLIDKISEREIDKGINFFLKKKKINSKVLVNSVKKFQKKKFIFEIESLLKSDY